jgi:hypothetical protein
MIGYKLFRVRKDGTIGSLFINRKRVINIGVLYKAKSYPTKGFKVRPYWHITSKPVAPHLSMKGRIWYKVEFSDYKKFDRPKNQGGLWYLAKNMKVLEKIK